MVGRPWLCTCKIDQARSRAIHSHGRPWIVCMTTRLDVTPKTTDQNRIVRTGEFEAEVTNDKKVRSRCTIEPNYWQTRSIALARPLCDSRTTCHVCSVNCTEDYLAVYDGMTSSWPLIGRFCGRNGAHLISSGTSMFLVFLAGPRSAPSFNHSGFSLQIVDRWKSNRQHCHVFYRLRLVEINRT